jgi:hypothetical protein
MRRKAYFCMSTSNFYYFCGQKVTGRLLRSEKSATMSDMTTQREAGYVSGVLVSLILVSVFLLGALGFGVWAFMGRQDYKDNVTAKVEVAVGEAVETTKVKDAEAFAEEAKNPLKAYVGPSAYGSVSVLYPKTWSGYVVERNASAGGVLADYFFHPNVVPDAGNTENAFALRVQVTSQSYDSVVKIHEAAVESKKATAAPYALPKVGQVVGTRIEGQLNERKQGSMIILPVRNLTLIIWTEADQFKPDFNNIILPYLSFSP